MIYISSNTVRRPVTKNFTTLHCTSLHHYTSLIHLLYVFIEMLGWCRRYTFKVDPYYSWFRCSWDSYMGTNESRTSVLCCVLVLKQIKLFYRVISSPLSRPAIWAMCLRTSEGPGASSADGRAMRTAVRVPDRERCVLRRVRVWTCSTARGSWPKGCTTRRG